MSSDKSINWTKGILFNLSMTQNKLNFATKSIYCEFEILKAKVFY